MRWMLLVFAAYTVCAPLRLSAAQEPRAALVAKLDSLARAALTAERLAGLSVAVVRGRDTLLAKGYGRADIGLDVPVTTRTTFRAIGVGTQTVAVGLLQQLEAGRLRIDDDAAALIPDFPWQGRHPTIRQLMDATSGLPDFHYLGDPLYGARGVPKALDEITALFAGLPFTHEPGARFQWTISGFHLAGVLLERLSGIQHGVYVHERILSPAGLRDSYYCDDRTIVPGLARGYEFVGNAYRNAAIQSATMYPFDATLCMTALDAVRFARALRGESLIRLESYHAMSTAVGAAQRVNPANPAAMRGFGTQLDAEDGHRWVGVQGSLMGFNAAVMDFEDDSLTIVALANTSNQGTSRLARRLARAVLGLPALPATSTAAATPPAAFEAAQVRAHTTAERARYTGTYELRLVNGAPQYASFRRTYRVFEENGRLMLQPRGDPPVELIYIGDDRFVRSATPGFHIGFTIREGRAVHMVLGANAEPTAPREEGPRVGHQGSR